MNATDWLPLATRPLLLLACLAAFLTSGSSPAWGATNAPLRSSAYSGTANSWVSFPARPEWDGSVSLTVEAWVFRRNASRCETILSHDWPGSYWLGFCPRLRFYRGTNFAELSTPLPAFKWTHVAVTYDGAVARFHVNGEYVGARSLAHTGAGKLRKLRLGHNWPQEPALTPSDLFLGNLDEVRLWSTVRTAAEIREGMHRELRAEPGLVAAFPRGGRLEEVSGLPGTAGAGVTEQIAGMLPRDLVVPLAAVAPAADGVLNLNGEYLGADQLVLRYPEDLTVPDAVAYFIRTTNDLFVGVAGHRRNTDWNWSTANTTLGLFLDTSYTRPPLAQGPQVQVQAYQDYDTNRTYWLNGDGAGGYFQCVIDTGIGTPRPCVSRTRWQVGKALCGDDVDPPPPCTEFRVSLGLLGSWNEYDGVALGHFNFSPFGDQAFVPETGYPDSPATWLTMAYGSASALLPRVRLTGTAYDGLTNWAPRLAGHRISLLAGGTAYTNLTDAFGRFAFDIPVPTGEVIRVMADTLAFGRSRLPTLVPGQLAVSVLLTNEVRFQTVTPGTTGPLNLGDVSFYVQRPPPAAGITNADPALPMAGYAGSLSQTGGLGDVVFLQGTNLHAEIDYYLSPFTTAVGPSQWTLLPVPTVERTAFGSYARVQVPTLPTWVRLYQNGPFVSSTGTTWRWVGVDRWTRPNMITYIQYGPFAIRPPPYPLLHGFQFQNRPGDALLNEFLACYGNNAYLCVGAFDTCLTRVPDPLYWTIWWPVYYFWISNSGGSCVGMAGTSLQFAAGVLDPAGFEPGATSAIGIPDPGFPGEWDTSNIGGRYTRPPQPKDVWARIRANHGVQTSQEYMLNWLEQYAGDPAARLNALRQNPLSFTLLMRSGGNGHAVTPYRVETHPGGNTNLSRVWVYDNNTPCGPGSVPASPCVQEFFVDVDVTSNRFTYAPLGWSGSSLYTPRFSLYQNERHMPLLDLEVARDLLLFIVAGGADGHYTAPGREWGWRADGTFVEQWPGLQSLLPLGSPTNQTRSVPVLLPASNALPTLHLNVRQPGRHLFHAGAQGTHLQLETLEAQAGSRDQIQLGTRSNQLASFRYLPQLAPSNFVARVGFPVSTQASVTFQWIGLSGEGGRAQDFRALRDRRAAEYGNLTTRPTRHYLRIDAVDGPSTNNSCAVFGPFTVPAGAIHCAVLHDWPRARQLRSELDLNADGVPDQVNTVAGTALDSDQDGLPDDWETLHQLDPETAGCDDGGEADPDRDGVSNLGEFLTGTHPRDPASALRLQARLLPGRVVRLSWRAVPGRRYEILHAEDLWHVFRPLPNAGFPRLATGEEEYYDDLLPAGAPAGRYYQIRLVP